MVEKRSLPVPIIPVSVMHSDGALLQLKANCACGGSCPRCERAPDLKIQTEAAISKPGDQYEQLADRAAEQVMRMPDPSLQRKCTGCTDASAPSPNYEEEVDQENTILRKREFVSDDPPPDDMAPVKNVLSSRGQELDRETRGFFEPRFGYDFGDVRVHTDSAAAGSARAMSARGYTVGNNIVFAAGQYQPRTETGKRLVAHELAHVVQQGTVLQKQLIQRDCDDPNFCKPLNSYQEVIALQQLLRTVYLPLEATKFNNQTKNLYERYLSRRPGDSLAPVEFNDANSDLVKSFAESWATSDDQDAIIDLIGARLSRVPLQPGAPVTVPVERFLSRAEMDNRDITFSNPFSIAGHIAGGIGSSDAGDDYRKILSGDVTLEKVELVGSTGYVLVSTSLNYEVFDAVDFCPGDCGSPAEQLITIPMSRLEASNEAYDVPFKVTFVPESRSKRFWY